MSCMCLFLRDSCRSGSGNMKGFVLAKMVSYVDYRERSGRACDRKHTLRKSDAITLTAEATYTGMNLSTPKS